MGDIASLIAPRPFCALNSEKDDIYPVTFAREQFETVRKAYELNNASDACQLRTHSGGDAYINQASWNWFGKWLK